MTAGIYHAVLKASYQGQAFRYGLWYKSVIEGTALVDWALDGAKALAQSIKEEVWTLGMKPTCPTDYSMDSISIAPYNDVAELVYQSPLEYEVNEQGSMGLPAMAAPGVTVNFHFSMKPTVVSNPLFHVPSKGLFGMGPVREDYIGNDGRVNEAGETAYGTLADKLAASLDWPLMEAIDLPIGGWQIGVGIPGAFVPVRVNIFELTTPEVIGGITLYKHLTLAEVSNVILRKLTGYRRSRMVE